MIRLLDCTLRDGGYYNAWDFPLSLINDYLVAMQAGGVDIVEIGFRSLKNEGFKGACAYTTDDYIQELVIPDNLTLGVMINGAELVGGIPIEDILHRLFPLTADASSIKLVRIACHAKELPKALPASVWLKERGYLVGFNIMQIADLSQEEINNLASLASSYPLDVLYFADSMGSMYPEQVGEIIQWLRVHWTGEIGIHTHDNMGMALLNSMRALGDGATWLDATVTGMGRGPGNCKTEYLALELSERKGKWCNIVPLMEIISRYFRPMQVEYGWGTNTYYYLAGKYGIHPSYVQAMLSDSRYTEADLLAVIDHLRVEGGKRFSLDTLDAARQFYQGEPRGTWEPFRVFQGREVLLLGTGPGVKAHRVALESFIRRNRPLVVALNAQSQIDSTLIDFRVASHPVRLLADCEIHTHLPQPLITPASMLPLDVQESLKGKELLDFGILIKRDTFEFANRYCVIPTPMVIMYALAVASSGRSSRVLLAGFDGYPGDDPRNHEMDFLLHLYQGSKDASLLQAITPTRYAIPSKSIYAL